MLYIMMSYLVSDTNRTPKVQLYVAVRIVYYYDKDDSARTDTNAAVLSMFLSFLTRGRVLH